MKPCVATVGTFDGIHAGHLAIIDRVNVIAEEKGLPTRVITFANHPLSVVAPERAPKWAVARQESLRRLALCVDEVVSMDFTEELAAMTAREFMEVVREKYNVDTLVMGYDNTFGSDRLSTHEEYLEAGRDVEIEVAFVDAVYASDGLPVSSSRLRKAISVWDYPLILELMGHAPLYRAKVIEGKKLGRKIGFPTMNLELPDDIVPLPDGVYLAVFCPAEGEEGVPAVLSVGSNPTVGGNGKNYELHVPGMELGDMYGKEIHFSVRDQIRGVKKFASVDLLRRAIEKDVAAAKEIYRDNHYDAPSY